MKSPSTYYAFATITVKPEYLKAAEQAVLDIIPDTLNESGCEMFRLHKDGDPSSNKLYLYEVFRDEAAFHFHHAQNYTKAVFEKYQQWLAEPVDIKRLFAVSDEV